MATELTHTINVGVNTFDDMRKYLDRNPEYLLFTSPSGETLKVDLEQQDESSSGKAKNSVILWCEQIIKIVNNYYSKENPNADVYFNSIKQICVAIKIAAGCVE